MLFCCHSRILTLKSIQLCHYHKYLCALTLDAGPEGRSPGPSGTEKPWLLPTIVVASVMGFIPALALLFATGVLDWWNIWDIICMTWVPQPLIPSLFFPYVLIKFMQIEVQTTPSCLMKRAFCQLGPAAQHNWATAVAQATQTPPFIDPATVKRATRHFSRKKYDW